MKPHQHFAADAKSVEDPADGVVEIDAWVPSKEEEEQLTITADQVGFEKLRLGRCVLLSRVRRATHFLTPAIHQCCAERLMAAFLLSQHHGHGWRWRAVAAGHVCSPAVAWRCARERVHACMR